MKVLQCDLAFGPFLTFSLSSVVKISWWKTWSFVLLVGCRYGSLSHVSVPAMPSFRLCPLQVASIAWMSSFLRWVWYSLEQSCCKLCFRLRHGNWEWEQGRVCVDIKIKWPNDIYLNGLKIGTPGTRPVCRAASEERVARKTLGFWAACKIWKGRRFFYNQHARLGSTQVGHSKHRVG